MHYDVIVIGGSYAGMAAALQLARAHKSVLVIDAGERRNRFASHSHGFLGQDGVDPGEIAANARRQLETYPTLSWLESRVEHVSGQLDGFTVTAANDQSHQGRRILLAIGVADQLPPVKGLAERWGKAVFHCPYCHGYELGKGRIGVIATGPMSIHQAQFLTEWGEVTLLVNHAITLDLDARSDLERRGVAIEDVPINTLEGNADVRMADGRLLGFAGLFTAARAVPSSALAEAMGCALEETPMGLQVRTDAESKTSVPGVFACGDVARVPHSVSIAVGNGALTGILIHRSLFWPEPVGVSSYGEKAAKLVPGLRDLHKMASVLLAERAPTTARILVRGAGGGLELKAFAEMQPGWQFDGVDPSAEMLQLARTTLGNLAARVRLWEGYIDSAPLEAFDGATCLLTLHFLPQAERLKTLKEMYRRLKPGAAIVIAHHSFSSEGPDPDKWLKRYAAYGIASGVPAAQAEDSIAAIRERLPALSPQQDADLLGEAGFVNIELFYCAFTFKGWVATRP